MGVVASAASYDREGLTGPLTSHLPLRFSIPYADSGVVLVISSRSSVRRLEDLRDQKVGVMVGTVEHEWLAKHGFRVSVFASQEDIIAAIEAGEIEVGATNPVVVGWYRHEHPGTAVRIPDGYEPEPALHWSVSVGLRRADDALLRALDAAVARVVKQRLPAQTAEVAFLTQCMVRPCVARGFVELAVSGLASMYPAFDWSICSGPSWISARVRSH